MKQLIITISLLLSAIPVLAQQKSAKRGMGWDEKTQAMTQATIAKMAPGVSWVYNWGATPKNELSNLGPGKDMEFVPMCWNGNFNETQLRNYLTQHPGVKYVLGFNEPNFSAQSNMTPAQAVEAWQKLEAIADDYGLELVAPALNFTGEKVGGRTWSPFEWYDEFFRLRPNAKVDYLAMHCYMNWAENVDWITSRYFYTDAGEQDLYREPQKSKYPNLVKFLDNYKAANGHFPKMFLTEFCSWEDNVYPNRAGLTVDFQIDQMTQKLQYMEKSDLVAGYAWFMANPGGGANEHPHESIFLTNTPTSELSTLGKVYVNMSSFDTGKYYAPGEEIQAKDYIDASMDNQQVKVRPNTDAASTLPLQVEFCQSAWSTYQIDMPAAGEYTLTLRLKTDADAAPIIDIDKDKQQRITADLTKTNGTWQDQSFSLQIPAGQHILRIFNSSAQTFLLNRLELKTATGIHTAQAEAAVPTAQRYYNLQGKELSAPQRGIIIVRTTCADGTIKTEKRVIQ